MFTKARNYTNELTELIKKDKNIPVEIVFSHELLSVTIRNEATVFLDYIFPKDEINNDNPKLPKFDLVIDYALTDKPYYFEEDESEKPFDFIVSRNAANFLSSPSKKLNEFGNQDKEKRIFQQLRNFISTKEAKTNSMCAGNFTRIFLTWYSRNPEEFEDNAKTKKFYKDKFTIKKLVQFCVLNIQELSYAELLERFLTTEFEPNKQYIMRSLVMYEILQKVRDIIGEKITNNELDNGTNSFTIFKSYSAEMAKQIKKSQPLSWKFEQVPIPSYLGYEIDSCRPLNASVKIDISDVIPIKEKKITWNEEEKSLFAYTLLNIIWSASSESCTIFEFIQSQQAEGEFIEKKRILEYLLFIGVFGYENVMLSSTAFRILEPVINGDKNLEILPISKKDRKGENNIDLIDYYADFVVFNASNVSNLAIFSFPIFYNHVYENLKAEEDSIVTYKFFDLKSRYTTGKDRLRTYITNEKGLTPFVYMLPTVLAEPPLSTDLCTSYIKILNNLCDERLELTNNIKDNIISSEDELKKAADRMKIIDNLYLDFITYKFEYQDTKIRYNIVELTEKIFPLDPRFYTKDKEKRAKLGLDKSKLSALNENADRARPIINNSFVQITNKIVRNDSFCNSEKGSILQVKKNVPIPIPQYKEKTKDGQGVLSLYAAKYDEIINESKNNKMEAGPYDPNVKLIAD